MSRGSLCASLALLLAASSTAAPLRAEDSGARRCESAYEGVQLSRQQGRLLAARDQAATCARDACPDVARKDCARWAGELAHEIPSVVVVARDEADHEVPGARLFVDGKARDELGSGRPFELDPGAHTFRITRTDGEGVEQPFTVYQGERGRVLRVVLPAPVRRDAAQTPVAPPTRPPPEGEAHGGSLIPALVVGGASLVVLAASAYLGLTGRQELSDLHGSCAPSCTDAQVDPVRTRLVASDVTLFVGLLGVATATSLFALRGTF